MLCLLAKSAVYEGQEKTTVFHWCHGESKGFAVCFVSFWTKQVGFFLFALLFLSSFSLLLLL